MEFFLGLNLNSLININDLLDEIELEIGVQCKSQLPIIKLESISCLWNWKKEVGN
jgi:hypothetical protein